MMQKIMKFINKNSKGLINCLALALVASAANSACAFYFHEPEFPEAANKFKKLS